ncbi:Histone H1.0 [Strongyloides ratti]|uniref:Histone H1.0 n=1 Tax=Strongyloides ratti TaxID=34506 RepID=A0A090KXU4_STRRB|nr:Histone H1.0 [Strongyloides ratti]CEF62335.1 Histone H1.0 [Strongyloides ratti]
MTTDVTVQPAAAGTSTKKASTSAPKSVKKSSHPVYADMVKKAIIELKEKKGSSKPAILKYIKAHYNLGDKNINSVNLHIKQALKKGLTSGILKQTSGNGASGSFTVITKVDKKPKVVKKVKKTEKPSAEKKVVKKAVVKKSSEAKKVTDSKKSTDVKKTPETKKAVKAPKAKATEKKVLKKAIVKKTKAATPLKKAATKVVKKAADTKKKSSSKKVTDKKN